MIISLITSMADEAMLAGVTRLTTEYRIGDKLQIRATTRSGEIKRLEGRHPAGEDLDSDSLRNAGKINAMGPRFEPDKDT